MELPLFTGTLAQPAFQPIFKNACRITYYISTLVTFPWSLLDGNL